MNSTRRDFLKSIALAGAAAMIPSVWAAEGEINKGAQKLPNILFIIADDQPKDAFGYISHKALTPNIDRLANQGVCFSRSYTTSSICTPSRYSCITGQYPSRCQTEYFKKTTPDDLSFENLSGATNVYGDTHVGWNTDTTLTQLTLPRLLKKRGYVTGKVGKRGAFILPPMKPLDPNGGLHDPEINRQMKERHQQLVEGYKKLNGFDYAAAVYGDQHFQDLPKAFGLHNMEWVVKGVLDFIDLYKDKPWYMHMAVSLCHWYNPIDSMKADPRITGEGLLEKPLDVMPSRESVFKRVKEAGLPEQSAMATWLDDGVGAVLQKLEDLKILDNTLVIYFNDNGTNGKGTLYEDGINVPLMFYWKNKIKPLKCNELVQNTDILPTVLDAAKTSPPSSMKLDGKDLMPLMMGKQKSLNRKSLYCELGFTRSVCTDKWKYIAFRIPEKYLERVKQFKEKAGARYEGYKSVDHLGRIYPEQPSFAADQVKIYPHYFDKDQLFDLEKDPNEQNNLANDPKYSDKLNEMKNILKNYMTDLPGTFGEFKISEARNS